MFGEGVMDEVTSNILVSTGYPRELSVILSVFIAIIPLTKLPLNARPIVSTIEMLCGLDFHSVPDRADSSWSRGLMKIVIRIAVIVVFVVVAILFPAFDSIMAFMGSKSNLN